MKTFIVFAAVVVLAAANTINRASGWGAPSAPVIDLELVGAAAAAAAGQASAGQSLLETASGDSTAPAYVSSLNYLLATVNQGEDLTQINVVDKPSGATSTINIADVGNQALAIDDLQASLGGANSATVQNSANTDASGAGVIEEAVASLNSVSSKRKH